MPVHSDILDHVEIAGPRGQQVVAQIEIHGQGEIVHETTDIAHVRADVGVVIQIGPGIWAAPVRAVGVADLGNGGAVDGGPDNAVGARRIDERVGELAAHVRPAHLVVEAQTVVEIEAQLVAERQGLRGDAHHADALEIAAAIDDQKLLIVDRMRRIGTAVESGEGADVVRGTPVEIDQGRRSRVVRFLCVGELNVEADVTLVAGTAEVARKVGFDLHAVAGVEADPVRTLPLLEVGADVIGQRVAERTAIAEAESLFVEAYPRGQRNLPPFLAPGARNVVDDSPRRLRREGCGGAAAHALDTLYGFVETRPVIVVAELDIAEQHRGQAIFLNLDERRAAGSDGQTAHGDVGIAARTDRARYLNAGNHAQDLRLGGGLKILDQVRADTGYRCRRFELRAIGAGGRGHHHFFQQSRLRGLRDLIVRGRLSAHG